MLDSIGMNPFQYPYVYQPGGNPAVDSLPEDMNLQASGAISDEMPVNNKPKFGDALLGKTTKDCKT